MPIYCYKCRYCEERIEELHRQYGCPSRILHACPRAGGALRYMDRDLGSEVSKTHTQGTYQFTPHFDAGAGRSFASKAEYAAWQRANTDGDDAVPEPLQGKRKVAMYEEALHASHINQQVQIDEKAERAALGKAYDAAHDELAACDRLGVKPPSLDD